MKSTMLKPAYVSDPRITPLPSSTPVATSSALGASGASGASVYAGSDAVRTGDYRDTHRRCPRLEPKEFLLCFLCLVLSVCARLTEMAHLQTVRAA